MLSRWIPHYQPIVSLQEINRPIVGHECLARFVGPGYSLLGPNDLKDEFREPRFLTYLFNNSFYHVIKEIQSTPIFLNLHAVVADSPIFLMMFEKVISSEPHLKDMISLELTERQITMVHNLPEKLKNVQQLGVKIVLDDFGTGEANLEILEKFGFDGIKIDGQFLKNCTTQSGVDRLNSIVELLRCYSDSPLVAEHIETEEIACVAKRAGIEYGQGYLFGRPIPALPQLKRGA